MSKDGKMLEECHELQIIEHEQRNNSILCQRRVFINSFSDEWIMAIL